MSQIDQVAIITGGSRGIGRSISTHLAAQGAAVCINYSSQSEPAEALVKELQTRGKSAIAVQADVSEPAQAQTLIERANAELGPPTILINNAGIMGQSNATRGNIDYTAWQSHLSTNVLGPARVAETFADNIIASKQKKLIIISSRMGSIAATSAPNSIVYRSSKAAVNMVMKILANDLGPQGVTVTSFHPG